MKRYFFALFACIGLVLSASNAPAQAEAVIGKTAPDFKALDTYNNPISLDMLNGKIVVLEWTNNGCPYVRKHYDDGHMQKLQKDLAGEDLVWISVISSAPGKQGYMDAKTANATALSEKAQPTHIILDPTGEMGKAYGAKTTPHMYVIDKDGKLAYQGAIDSHPTFRTRGMEDAQNYVVSAVKELRAGQPVTTSETQPYGCSVKY
ncbi:MAG: redoxin domain-containing protein [Pseudomonadota bacterium]|jgi:peroxiredoxin|nr:thioredoxin family protein [Alphaproteobacteria bacterium]MCS5596813.1 redoxin domain-containing protein [Alphaproteobacteria bacterium]MEC7702202.1 redoxin domain-containing protein [Pseudomonadota bacterium]MEC9236440.1 redoxin domain-containing protein [Pseudomonadota bacterium]MED5423576.1 redoxin domain-containing protein [Pseudomonadota bacterium]|tara:strand:+ start:2006 stop:2620 length:615 start_codon:yes stop_codon:yes gene_type:complete